MLKVLSGLVLIGCVYAQLYRGQVDSNKFAGKFVYDLLRPALQPVEVAAIEASRDADAYPTLSCIPATPFDCAAKTGPGFYADADAAAGCQVFHRCDLNGNVTDYLCVNTTLFNQITLVCDDWFNVDCGRSLEYENFANSRLYTNQPLFDTPPAGYIAPSQEIARTVNVAPTWHPSGRHTTCQVVATPAPGPAPTEAPTAAPIVAPTEAPTPAPIVGTTGVVSGLITNAATGKGEPGVLLTVRAGKADKAGPTIATATSGPDGTYTLNLPSGDYTVELSKPGFVSNFITVTAVAGQTSPNQPGVISPNVAAGSTRVILSWGATPLDLDAHITVPLPGSTNRYHVFYSDRGHEKSSPFTTLDIDAQKGFGPETITIEKQFPGAYRYSVLDYTDIAMKTGSPLANSSAVVKILRGSEVINTFTVPNLPGNLWTVFELNGDQVTPVNKMTYQNTAAGVTK